VEVTVMSKDEYPAHQLSDIIDRLPPSARHKYRQLGAGIDDARALIGAARERRANIEQRLDFAAAQLSRLDPRTEADDITEATEELNHLRAELDALDMERSRRLSVQGNLQQTVSQVENWLRGWEAGIVRLDGPLRAAKLAPLDPAIDVETELPAVRRQIMTVQGEIAVTNAAPLPAATIKQNIREQIQRYADAGRPRLRLENGKVDLAFADMPLFSNPGAALAAPARSVTSTLCWLFGGQITKMLTDQIDDAVGDTGLSVADRTARLAELHEKLFALEQREELLVEAGLRRGLECHRRREASPLAVLGLEVDAAALLDAAE
jgi:hypothetical protein